MEQTMTKEDQTHTNTEKPKGNRRAFILGAALLGVLGTAAGVHAFADNTTAQHMRLAASGPGGWFSGMHHRAHWRGHHKGRFFDMSQEELEAKVTRIVKHVAIEIDATAEQQDKIIALVKSAAKDLRPLRDEMRAAGRQAHELLLAERLDRTALEALRAERLAETDRISKTLVNTIADIADILTPEQRKLLDERIVEMRAKRKGWHRG
jgi:Spy/CpxP family protein refolding chaperone